MRVEYFIARRSTESKRGGKPSVMVRVATISVALSVAMMILTLSVVFGFKREVNRSLTGFTSEAVISDIATINGYEQRPIIRSIEFEELLTERYGAQSVAPYVTAKSIVRSGQGIEGVLLRGVDSLYDFLFLSERLVDGHLPRFSGSQARRDILISSSLAQQLGLGVGSRLELIASQDDNSLRRDLFKICGLYSTGLDEWDRMILVTNMANVQRLNSWQAEQISGYELRFGSMERAAATCRWINEELFINEVKGVDSMVAFTTEQLYPALFDWLEAHNINAVVIIIIMLIVAGFNMATALLIMVLERTRMIAVLKSLGMNNGSLQLIFLYHALRITLYGLLWGNGVALALCGVQKYFHIIKLDAASYLLRYVPIDLGFGWILLLNVAVVATILLLMVLPSGMVGRVEIEKTLKFE